MNREQLDLAPIIELGDPVFQEGSERDNVTMQGSQAVLLQPLETAFGNDKPDLEIVAAVEKHKQLPVPEKAE